ncbi:DUF4229 domain-containing protein [Streptomyces sp. NPDC048384]|uniref:DUF4229 domain-containing protein n=1 Tax=unclassified Streptomyces TaxID=2593676 RepID=UPI0034443E22
MPKRVKYAGFVLVFFALLVVVIRFGGAGVGWGHALLGALVATPLGLWMIWLRRRMTEQAQEWGRRRFRPWPEERRR